MTDDVLVSRATDFLQNAGVNPPADRAHYEWYAREMLDALRRDFIPREEAAEFLYAQEREFSIDAASVHNEIREELKATCAVLRTLVAAMEFEQERELHWLSDRTRQALSEAHFQLGDIK